MTREELLKKYPKIAIYTCICGDYDKLIDPSVKIDGIDYICFTDQKFTSNVWDIREIPSDFKQVTNVKTQRCLKVCCFDILPEYDLTIWTDGNIVMKPNFEEYVCRAGEMLNDYDFILRQHPERDCIYDELTMCVKCKKEIKSVTDALRVRYENEKMPKNFGLFETCVLFRKHNKNIMDICDKWWNEIRDNSHRDQLSLTYVFWKYNFTSYSSFTHEDCMNYIVIARHPVKRGSVITKNCFPRIQTLGCVNQQYNRDLFRRRR